MLRTAVLLTVGDEILAGYTLDTNSHWLAQRLRERGVRVLSKETLPDDPAAVAHALDRHFDEGSADVIIVMGGIGPTPDDRTYEGVAQGLNAPLELTPENRAVLERRVETTGYGRDLLADADSREALDRMFRLPRGAQALPNHVGAALGAWVATPRGVVVVVPGVPAEMKAMMEAAVLPRLGGDGAAEHVAEVEVRGEEARWYAMLRRLEAEDPDVRVGSYPQDEGGRLILRVSGPRERVEAVAARLREHAATHAKGPRA